jgi:hypothetical protein
MNEEEIAYFHPEDELFARDALTVSIPFTNKESGESELKMSLLLMLVEKAAFVARIGEMAETLGSTE